MRKFLNKYYPKEKLKAPFLILATLLIFITGIITKLSEKFLDLIIAGFPTVWKNLLSFLVKPIKINILILLLVLIGLYPLYHFIVRFYLRIFKKDIIFEDNFTKPNKYWGLNYWQGKANSIRFEQNELVFEPQNGDWQGANGNDGAFIDLTYGIYEGAKYQISCQAKSLANSTIGFQLWVHDTIGNDPNKFLFDPLTFETPPTSFKTYKVVFQATDSNSIRIHLHGREGIGKIMITNVVVEKVKR